jgi:hypothetical protein
LKPFSAVTTEFASLATRARSLALGDDGRLWTAALSEEMEDSTALVSLGKSDLAELATASASAFTVWASVLMAEKLALVTSLFRVSSDACRSSVLEQNSGLLLPQPAVTRATTESRATPEAIPLLIGSNLPPLAHLGTLDRLDRHLGVDPRLRSHEDRPLAGFSRV